MMIARKIVQRVALVTIGLPVLVLPASALHLRRSYSALYDAADLVAIATPVERRVVDAMAFLPSPGGDSIPVVAIETRFRVLLGLKGVAWPDTFVFRYHLHREVPAEIKVGATVFRLHFKHADPAKVYMGDECRNWLDPLLDSPVDFKPEEDGQYLMIMTRLNLNHYKAIWGACPHECVRPLKGRFHRDPEFSAANRALQLPGAARNGKK
jgi:hypothetical protein